MRSQNARTAMNVHRAGSQRCGGACHSVLYSGEKPEPESARVADGTASSTKEEVLLRGSASAESLVRAEVPQRALAVAGVFQ